MPHPTPLAALLLLLLLPLALLGGVRAGPAALWGTYRPNLYFGLRARLPHSPLFSVAWHGLTDFGGHQRPRFDAGSGLGTDEERVFAWRWHDGRAAGEQVMRDVVNNAALRFQWLGQPAGWGVRISAEPIDTSKPSLLALYLHFAAPQAIETVFDSDDAYDAGGLPAAPAGSDTAAEALLRATSEHAEIGEWSVRVAESPQAKNVPADPEEEEPVWGFWGTKTDQGWNAHELVGRALTDSVRAWLAENGKGGTPPPPASLLVLPNEIAAGANLLAFSRGFKGAFSVDIFFSSNGSQPLDGAALTAGLAASREAYDERLERTLGLRAKGFSDKLVAFASELTSSLLGGIGYFYGSSIVDRSFRHAYDTGSGGGKMDFDEEDPQPDPRLTEERGLLTATPCRDTFPRGFYWDEGFHLAQIGTWDNDLSLDILDSWIDLIDDDGWVAREQILGEEARKRVPQEFQTQYPLYANPPTLIMGLTMYIDRLNAAQDGTAPEMDIGGAASGQQVFGALAGIEGHASELLRDADAARDFLKRIYSRLRTHYLWFRRTQAGEIDQWDRAARSNEAYRWRGRSKTHVLTSGMDDYPRAPVPHSGELHLDLLSWIGSFADAMRRIAEATGEEAHAAEYAEHQKGVVQNLEDLHWSDDEQMYCDASVDEFDQTFHVCHKGYMSLFPFLLGLLEPDSERLAAIFDLVQDPQHLWSDFGVRSLSMQDPNFGQGEDYWRGAIWMPMNYLALQALHKKYAREHGPQQERAQQLYSQLRDNLINNTFKEYERTGYVWEQYNARTGHGQRNKPFTGWTSLVALIMAEKY